MCNDEFLSLITAVQNQIVDNNLMPFAATLQIQKEKDTLKRFLHSSFSDTLNETLKQYCSTEIEDEIKEKLQEAVKSIMKDYKDKISNFGCSDDFDIKIDLDNSYKKITVTMTPKTEWAEEEIKKWNQ